MRWPWSDPDPLPIVYPHATVNLYVSQEAVTLMRQEPVPVWDNWAASTVLRDAETPRSILHLTEHSGFTEQQARGIAHELSHLTAMLLGIPDRTHEQDGGRL